MSGNKHFDKIAWIITALTLLFAILFMNGAALGIEAMAHTIGYENRLFDSTRVHTIDIVMDDWDAFITDAAREQYYAANVVIDGEAYKNVGIRAKGNTSLSTVASLGSERYSFKIEFDQYDSGKTYHGLDKLSLNNLIQDSTMMKDYLTYTMMRAFNVSTPLCSFVYITVNGEDWGLYLAVEGVEEAFLKRNYGSDYGRLYKPDSMSFGGGFGGGFGMGSSDVKLQYIDDQPDSYSNIWNNAKTDITEADQKRLIESLKKLSNGKDIEAVVDMEQVLRYFVVHNYVCNDDSYTGMMVHNYYLYEENGQLAMIPWDYNLGFGTFGSGDATSTVNTPIDSPVSGGSSDRPMLHWIFENEEYTGLYHQYFSEFIETVDIAGMIDNAYNLIKPYVAKDPTAFYSCEEFELGVETLRLFCEKRSESISMQLENEETSSNMRYVDASDLTLSDMGSMNGGGGGFGGSLPGDRKEPEGMNPDNLDFSDPAEGFNPPEGFDLPQGFDPPDNPTAAETSDADAARPFDRNMQKPGGDFPFDTSSTDAPPSNLKGFIGIAFSAAILAAGLIVAKKYRY